MMVLDIRSEKQSLLAGRVRHALTGGANRPREMAVLVRSADDEQVVQYLAELSGYRTTCPMGPGSRILVLRKAA